MLHLFRKLLCLLFALLLPFSCAGAEKGWADADVPLVRIPEEISVIPWEELGNNGLGQHHYLLLCIDQWRSRPRPEGIAPPTDEEGHRRDFFGNTDGMVILTLDTAARRIMLCSIVRDAIILKPDTTPEKQSFGRINYVYNDYGPEALCRLISQHLGIKIEKYILFNFSQIQDIIDLPSLDGVEIELTRDEIGYLSRYAVPRHSVIKSEGYYSLYGDPLTLSYETSKGQKLEFSFPASAFQESGTGKVARSVSFPGSGDATATFEKNGSMKITLPDGTSEKGWYSYDHGRLAVMTGADVYKNARAPVGTYHMSGHSALLYMRIRKSSRGDTDFMRTQRVRNVLSALADHCRKFTLDQANDLANSIMQHNDTTNMSLKEMTDAAAIAYDLRDCTIEEFRVPAQEDVRSINFASMSALEINWASTRSKYLEFLDHTTLVRDMDFVVVDDDN